MAGRHDHRPLNMVEQAEHQRRFPRAGYWFGMLPAHPDVPDHYQRAQYYPPPYHYNAPHFNGQPGIPVPHPPPPPLPVLPHVAHAVNNPAELPPPYRAVVGQAMDGESARVFELVVTNY